MAVTVRVPLPAATQSQAGVVVVKPLMVRRHKSMSYHTPLARPRHCAHAARAASAAPAIVITTVPIACVQHPGLRLARRHIA